EIDVPQCLQPADVLPVDLPQWRVTLVAECPTVGYPTVVSRSREVRRLEGWRKPDALIRCHDRDDVQRHEQPDERAVFSEATALHMLLLDAGWQGSGIQEQRLAICKLQRPTHAPIAAIPSLVAHDDQFRADRKAGLRDTAPEQGIRAAALHHPDRLGTALV